MNSLTISSALLNADQQNNISINVNKKKKGNIFKDNFKKVSGSLFNNIKNRSERKDMQSIVKGIEDTSQLSVIYGKYTEEFANLVARKVIKGIISHAVENGQYDYLHMTLTEEYRNKYLNDEEKNKMEKSINLAASNYIKIHNGVYILQDKPRESGYDFEYLVKIIYTDYISEPIRKEAEKVVLKRVSNKKEDGKFLLSVRDNDKLSENMRKIAGESLIEHDRLGVGKYQKHNFPSSQTSE